MMKEEFESRIGAEISTDEYKIVETVYAWHPAIPNVGGKDVIAQLYTIGGMALMADMFYRAQSIELEDTRLRADLRKIVLRKGEIIEELTKLERQIAELNAEFATLTSQSSSLHEQIEQLERGN